MFEEEKPQEEVVHNPLGEIEEAKVEDPSYDETEEGWEAEEDEEDLEEDEDEESDDEDDEDE